MANKKKTGRAANRVIDALCTNIDQDGVACGEQFRRWQCSADWRHRRRRWRQPGRRQDERRGRAIESRREFKRALRLPGDHVKVRWYRGLVLKRLGRHVDALREFRFVVASDPLHFEAAREVRVYEARLRRSPKNRPSLAPEGPPRRFNLLSWLFTRRGSRMA